MNCLPRGPCPGPLGQHQLRCLDSGLEGRTGSGQQGGRFHLETSSQVAGTQERGWPSLGGRGAQERLFGKFYS